MIKQPALLLPPGMHGMQRLGSCDFSYGIIGYVDANITKKNGTAGPVRGTYVDLSGYTQGQCLADGYSWGTGTTKSGTDSSCHDSSTSTIANVTGTRAGCLECHNSVSQRNSYAERWKEDLPLDRPQKHA